MKLSTLIVATLITFSTATTAQAKTPLIRAIFGNGVHHKVRSSHHGNRHHQRYQHHGQHHQGHQRRRVHHNNHRQHRQVNHGQYHNNHNNHNNHGQHHNRTVIIKPGY